MPIAANTPLHTHHHAEAAVAVNTVREAPIVQSNFGGEATTQQNQDNYYREATNDAGAAPMEHVSHATQPPLVAGEERKPRFPANQRRRKRYPRIDIVAAVPAVVAVKVERLAARQVAVKNR